MKPLFIFSLPRSGSTLLQRILSGHPEISTVSEPWLLLPQIYTLKEKGVFSEYSHANAFKGISEFCESLPGGQDSYCKELRLFISRLYEMAAEEGAEYFLDKTPRYSLVADEIINLFPNGKFIFLWRNPLSVCASMQQTWADGKWNLYNYKIDLFQGLDNALETYERYADRVCSVRFEDLLEEPENQLARIFNYLELPCNGGDLDSFQDNKLSGEMGDQTGIKQYASINKGPLDKWKEVTRNPLRKRWARRYLTWIGERRLKIMGYELEQLLEEISETPGSLKFLCSDIMRSVGGTCYSALECSIIKEKIKSIRGGRRVYHHS